MDGLKPSIRRQHEWPYRQHDWPFRIAENGMNMQRIPDGSPAAAWWAEQFAAAFAKWEHDLEIRGTVVDD